MANRDRRDILFPAVQYPPAALAAGRAALRKSGGNIRAANDAAEAMMREVVPAAATSLAPAAATKPAEPTPAPAATNDNPSARILGARFGSAPGGQQRSIDLPLGGPVLTPAAARILAARFGDA